MAANLQTNLNECSKYAHLLICINFGFKNCQLLLLLLKMISNCGLLFSFFVGGGGTMGEEPLWERLPSNSNPSILIQMWDTFKKSHGPKKTHVNDTKSNKYPHI